METKKRKINLSNSKDLDDLIVVGMMGETEKRHRKKVREINELIEMRIKRKKEIKELMAKRSGHLI
jgi:hypothetical protein